MTPHKEHAPALMQQAADEAVARFDPSIEAQHNDLYDEWLAERGIVTERAKMKDTIISLDAQLAAAEREINSLRDYIVYGDEQGVEAGLEMAAKVAEKALEPLAKLSSDVEWDDVPDNARADVVYRSEAGGEESVGTIAFADFRRARAAIRALADQHKPSPAEEPMP